MSRIFALLFMLPTLTAAAVGAYFYISTKAFVARATACQGRVVEMTSTSGENGAMYTPVFEFVDAAATVHHGRSSMSSNPPAYSVGDSIALVYDPNKPEDVRINSFWSLWLGCMICLILTLPFLTVALIFFFLVPFAIRRIWPESTTHPAQPPSLPQTH